MLAELPKSEKQKMETINGYVKEIYLKINEAHRLFDDRTPHSYMENQAQAREIYIRSANNLMLIMEKCKDNQEFCKMLKEKAQSILDTARRCHVPDQKQVGEQQQKVVGQYQPPSKRSKDERKAILATLDQKMVDIIIESVLDHKPGIKWDDIQGLRNVKQTLVENIVYPQMNPDLFSGIRSPDAGILLYGPPGNGKTMLAKAVATECKC